MPLLLAFLMSLLSLMIMNDLNFVAPEGSGYVTYLAGERIGWWDNRALAEEAFLSRTNEDSYMHDLACTRAIELARSWGHVRPDGSRVPYYEILAAAPSWKHAIDAWIASPDHSRILNMPTKDFGACSNNGYYVVIADTVGL